MNKEALKQIEQSFDQVSEALLSELKQGEDLLINLAGEHSYFLRMNNGRVRQTTDVEDGFLHLTYFQNQRTSGYYLPFTGHYETDLRHGRAGLAQLREQTPGLPEDPYIVLPQNLGSSSEVHFAEILPTGDVVGALLAPAEGLDLTGIYAGGMMYRGNRNNKGQRHWFVTGQSSFDYSLMAANEKTVKACFACSQWDDAAYSAQMEDSKTQLAALTHASVVVRPGPYRTYLAPAAVDEIVQLMSWSAFSESAYRQGRSPLMRLRQGRNLSSRLTMRENFSHGTTTRYNSLGEMAPEQMDLIRHGEMANSLINPRTAKEYGLISNGASTEEGCRAPEILPGKLARKQILEKLGTGLYLSNLHYLNWSDVPGGRLTGMTRFACFWVEKGEIVAPIENLRFDDSLLDFFGESLEELTDFQEFQPNVGTYFQRQLGGSLVPGALISKMTFTL